MELEIRTIWDYERLVFAEPGSATTIVAFKRAVEDVYPVDEVIETLNRVLAEGGRIVTDSLRLYEAVGQSKGEYYGGS